MLMLPFFVNNSITQSSKMRRLSSLINRNFIRAFASEAGQSSKPPPAAAAPPKPPKVEPPPPPPKVDPLKNVTGRTEQQKSYDLRKFLKIIIFRLIEKVRR